MASDVFRCLASFFSVKGQKKKGYICDAITLRVNANSDIKDYFRGRSEIFDSTLSNLVEPNISCYIYGKGRLFRVVSLDSLDFDDEIYICEEKYKDKLLQYVVTLLNCSISSTPTGSKQVSITDDDTECTSDGSRKRKREESLFDKLQAHDKRKKEDANYKKKCRQHYLERETVDAYRKYKGLSLVNFDDEYGELTWKKCKCLKS